MTSESTEIGVFVCGPSVSITPVFANTCLVPLPFLYHTQIQYNVALKSPGPLYLLGIIRSNPGSRMKQNLVVNLMGKCEKKAGSPGVEEPLKRSCYVMITMHHRSATRHPAEPQLVLEKRQDSKGGTYVGMHKYKN